jgi:hypothetical protein
MACAYLIKHRDKFICYLRSTDDISKRIPVLDLWADSLLEYGQPVTAFCRSHETNHPSPGEGRTWQNVLCTREEYTLQIEVGGECNWFYTVSEIWVTQFRWSQEEPWLHARETNGTPRSFRETLSANRDNVLHIPGTSAWTGPTDTKWNAWYCFIRRNRLRGVIKNLASMFLFYIREEN